MGVKETGERVDMPSGTQKIAWRLMDIVLTVSLFATLGVAGWTATKVVDLSERMSAIEGNRFTSADGLEVWKEIAAVRESIAAMPNEVPPDWFKAEVDEVKAKQIEIVERLIRVEERLKNHDGE